MPIKYLVIALARGTEGHFIPADALNNTKVEADADFNYFCKRGLNGEVEWPIHSVAEVVIGISVDDLMEAGACLWEAMLELKRRAPMGLSANLQEWWGANGTAACRITIISFAEQCHEAWVIAHREGEGFDDCFDWDFVPLFLTECLEWSEYGPGLKSDWELIAKEMGEKPDVR